MRPSLSLITVQEARKRLLEALAPLPTQTLPVQQALGQVLAQGPASLTNVPRFDNSAMDGFALRFADVADASEATPVTLRLAATTLAGDAPAAALQPGQAVRIMTGAPIPPGADAVIKQEDTTPQGHTVLIRAAVSEGNNIRRRGEVIAEGGEALAAGTPLRPAGVGWLVECGVGSVTVHRRPTVGLLTTGDEVVDTVADLGPGKILNSNLPALEAAVTARGYRLKHHLHVQDEREHLKAAILGALPMVDLLLITGGVSVGDKDMVDDVLREVGVNLLFHGVKQKPGKPILAATTQGAVVLGLPGNPASALVGFHVYGLPALRRLSGEHPSPDIALHAALTDSVHKKDQRTHFLRSELTFTGTGAAVTPLKGQGSHMLLSFAQAGALAVLDGPAGVFEAGTSVPVIPLEEVRS